MEGRDELWAITSYFNPIGFARRLANYRIFREHLRVPLVTVELARSPDRLQLRPGDADILIQLVGDDLLWQKERLLNIALQSVPATCRKIAWPDCDVVFERHDWGHLASAALDRFPMVQAFTAFSDLGPGAQFRNGDGPTEVLGGGESLAYRLNLGATVDELFRPHQGHRLKRGRALGMAWAARRDLVERHGLYDACILGSADKAMVLAALGRFELVESLELNARQMAHYLAWAKPFFDDVRAAIGHVDGRVYHLWHGDLENRKHRLRLVHFAPFEFDPFRDLVRDTSDCWRWRTERPEVRAYLQQYFESRREDG
ncbi:MAG TPA: hypothetical protein VMW17_18800 [Candidatus Binatia bacterium]|nr:hypothetical protein [Candidatus Binatia bacterium]